MSRITVIDHHNATDEQKGLLDAIQSQLGMVPNFLKVFANSPVALRAFLGLYGVANGGSLDAPTRERIALTLAQQNSCEYCVSAHTAIGRTTGLTAGEIAAARAGTSEDVKAAVAVKFARSLSENKDRRDHHPRRHEHPDQHSRQGEPSRDRLPESRTQAGRLIRPRADR